MTQRRPEQASIDELERRVKELERRVNNLPDRFSSQPPSTATPLFLARVISSELAFADGYKWKYTLRRMAPETTNAARLSDFVEQNDPGSDVVGYNILEILNPIVGGGMLGVGVTEEELESGECPLELRPLPDDDFVVMMRIRGVDDGEWWYGILPIANGAWEP